MKKFYSARHFPIALSAIGLIACATPALADEGEEFTPEGGVYLSLQAGVTLPSDGEFDGVQAPVAPSPGAAGAPANVEAEYDSGVQISGAVGYRIPTRIFGLFQPSVEVEYNYASPSVSGGNFNGGNQVFLGDIDVNTFSVNYQSDIRWANDQKVIPFWGGGIGIADVDANIQYFPNNGVATAPTFAVQGSDTGLNLHSNIGLRVELTDNIDLQARARYQRVTGLDFERTFVAGGNSAFNADVGGRYETVSFLAGLRYNF